MYEPYVTPTEYTDRGETLIPTEETGTLAYATPTDYNALGYSQIPSDALVVTLREASRQIDTLTFNRIVAIGFDKLTEFQQEVIKECVCKHANFLYENSDALSSIVDAYSINSVSMKFGTGFGVAMENGMPILKTVYSLLEQTGLCCRLAR